VRASSRSCPFFLADPAGEFECCWRYRAICQAAQTEAACIVDFDWPVGNHRRWQAIKRTRQGSHAKWDDSARLWAALCAFAAAAAALVRGCSCVAVGNERSANLGNGVSWGGVPVNHQYDKSFGFEARVHEYLLRCGGGGGVYYFSALMHLWDVQVVELFCRLARPMVPLIISCNEPLGKHNSRWCATCEKCAFVFALLSAFAATPYEALAVWGDDLFELSPVFARFDELCGMRRDVRLPDGRTLPGRAALAEMPPSPEVRCLRYLPGCDALKPLDCVGTAAEAKLALWLALCRRTERTHATGGARSAAAAGDPDGRGGASPHGVSDDHVPRYFRSASWRRVQAELERDPEAAGISRLAHESGAEGDGPKGSMRSHHPLDGP